MNELMFLNPDRQILEVNPARLAIMSAVAAPSLGRIKVAVLNTDGPHAEGVVGLMTDQYLSALETGGQMSSASAMSPEQAATYFARRVERAWDVGNAIVSVTVLLGERVSPEVRLAAATRFRDVVNDASAKLIGRNPTRKQINDVAARLADRAA